MSIQCTVTGLESTTLRRWVVTHNHFIKSFLCGGQPKDFAAKLQLENSNPNGAWSAFKHFKVIPASDWKLNKKQGDVEEYFVS